MTDTGLGAAVTRLERAIARLERATSATSPDRASAALEARHQQLRERVIETIARLDALIATREDAG